MRKLLPILLTILATGWPAAAVEEVDVWFVTPRNRTTVLGPGTVEVRVNVPEAAAIRHVELQVDGKTIATLTQPPWSAEWDAGDGSRGHELRATLVLEDGRQATASVRTRALTIDQVEQVDLVNLYLIVRDPSGRYVTDLSRSDFRIKENGSVQEIERFSTTHKPLRVAIVLDTSLTMSRDSKLEKARDAALQFLDVLQEGDEGLVVTFSDYVVESQPRTTDKELLAKAIRQAEAEGGTALYDAIWRTSRMLADFDGRKVLILLSDGRDEARTGLEPGSLHTLEEAVDQALRNDVMVFTIGLGRNLDREYAMRWGNLGGRSNVDVDRSLEWILRTLAEETGGRAIITASAGKLRKAFSRFAADLRHQYSIAYTSSDERRDGKWRKLDVEVPGQDVEVVTRKGYYAEQD